MGLTKEELHEKKLELERKKLLSLQDKIDLSCERIESWWKYWDSKVYIAFSGGKDSTVLLDLVRNKALIPDAKLIPAAFSDTGLEFPEIREFVKTVDNVVWCKPKMTFREVIEKYGYPVIGKEQARYLYDIRTSNSEKLKDIRINGNKWNMGKVSAKWKFMVDAPFKVSHMCCDKLKKDPAKAYERKTGRKCIIGSTTDESSMRTSTYLRHGCNAYDTTRPMSMPMAFWTEKDIWEYIHKYNIPYSSIYDKGYERTGCMFCMFGVQRETAPNRFQKMKVTHPRIYDYCINNLGIGDVLDYIGVNYG